MVTNIVEFLIAAMSGMPKEAIVFIVSMIPVVELRGGLICSSLLGLPMFRGVFFCLIGNMIPVPFILLFVTPIFNWLKKTKLFRPMVEYLETKSMGKSETIQKYEFLGLILFVGVPLPGTGAWTGSLIASLLDVKFRKALPAVYIGLVMATVIMCIITYGLPALVGML